MEEAQTYSLKIYDTELARFEFRKTMTGFRARGLEVPPELAHLLPLNMRTAPNDVELTRFLNSRRIPKGRVYLEEVLRPYGLAPSDTKGIIDLSRGASVNDAYSVTPADDTIPWREYNLFENDYDEVLQIIAYTGAIPEGVIGNGRPSDLTPSGMFPKTWRKIGGKLVLYKAGSPVAAPNYGKEPFAEYLASHVAQADGFEAVRYELSEWKGKVCSTCELFNTPEISFVPFELCFPADIMQIMDFELALSFFSELGQEALDAFKSMAVFDSVIANGDRHVGNFGVLRDNLSGDILGSAPIFDNNAALFTRNYDESLALPAMRERLDSTPGILDASLVWQGAAMLGDIQRDQVGRLLDFSFRPDGFIADYRTSHPDARDTITDKRLDALSGFVRARAQELLKA